jgi:hypothetical protein
MTSSMTKISTVTLSSTAATISFTDIPQIYTDLLIKLSSRTNRSGFFDDDVYLTFNGASTTYAWRSLQGNGTTTQSRNGATRYAAAANASSASANTFANADIYIPNYAAIGAKTSTSITVNGSNTTENYLFLSGNRWTTTSAITSIDLTSGTSNSFVAYTTATLYGIKNYVETGTGSKATGGTVTTSGGYTYHTFFSSGMFTPTASITGAEVLVVAGGGAGGWDQGGGGGAGGYRTSTGLSLTSGTAYQAIVGAGGSGNLAPSEKCNGNNSVFSAILASGGGGAGGYNQNGNAGGSGAGGGGANTGTGGTGGAGNVGSFSPVEGYAGGTSPNSQYSASGGGGAGGAGQNAPGSTAGKGGDGSNAESTWLTATNTGVLGYLAGGGGGGIYSPGGADGAAGGLGGGGFGGGTAGTRNGFPALANTGSGGGGGSGNGGLGGAGGSGLIIVRYTT